MSPQAQKITINLTWGILTGLFTAACTSTMVIWSLSRTVAKYENQFDEYKSKTVENRAMILEDRQTLSNHSANLQSLNDWRIQMNTQ